MNGMKLTSFTIDGVEVTVKDVRYDAVVTETEHRFSHGVTEIRCTAIFKGEDARKLRKLFDPPIRGATDAVLARRMAYGGRKGRSAWRRLRAKGFVGTMTINGERPLPLPPFRVTSHAAPDRECEACAGTGRYGFRDDDECSACGGAGLVPDTSVER